MKNKIFNQHDQNTSRYLEFFKSSYSECIHFSLVYQKISNHQNTLAENESDLDNKTADDDGVLKIGSYFELEPEETVNPYVYRKCLIKAYYPRYSFFFQNIFTWIDASAQVILPFIIMLVCNVNIIHKVLLTKNKTNGKNIKRLRKIKGL